MLKNIIEKTTQYIENMPKKERKKYGQFFTSMETAQYMASLFVIPEDQESISILDAGAGSGILSCAIVERLEKEENIKGIELTCYETDKNVLPLLKENLSFLQKKSCKKVNIKIVTDNYITSQYLDFNHMFGGNWNPKKYDLVIGNPPYPSAFTTAGTVGGLNKGASCIERKNAASDGTGNSWQAEPFWQVFRKDGGQKPDLFP